MAALHELAPEIQPRNPTWDIDDYASHVVLNLGKALEAAESNEIDLSSQKQSPFWHEDPVRTKAVQEALTEATILCLELAKTRQLPIRYSDLRLNWAHGLKFLVIRATTSIGETHWDVSHNNPVNAIGGINMTLAYIEDFSKTQGWQLGELVDKALSNGSKVF